MTEKHNSQQISICCSNTVRDILCEALKRYAQDVLPDKDAGQFGATRHEMLNVIRNIKQTCTGDDTVILLDSGYKGPCVAAIHHHYSRIHETLNSSVDEQKRLLLDMLHGVPASDSKLEAALRGDKLL